MLQSIFATKRSMTQAWDKQGRRLSVTRLMVEPNMIVRKDKVEVKLKKDSPVRQENLIFEIAYGKKKLKNNSKPLQNNLKKSGFSLGAKQFKGVRAAADTALETGTELDINQVLEVGDLVKVQGISKGKGFAGAMKRHGFSGGSRTHGQSDRERAVGSIGAGTYPGRVWKGKKMPGHMGVETRTVENLTVLYLGEDNELWLSGPIPGSFNSIVKITKTGKKKQVELDKKASGIPSTSSGTSDDKEVPEEQTQAQEDTAKPEEAEKPEEEKILKQVQDDKEVEEKAQEPESKNK